MQQPGMYGQTGMYGQQGMYGQGMYGQGQQGMYGQQGMMGQSMYGQQGTMGQPGMQPGQPGCPDQNMTPQFNFRTAVRFMTELAALIQGASLIGLMVGGMAQEWGSNEEQPIRRFGVWVASSVKGVITSILPFLEPTRRPIGSLEEQWDLAKRKPSRPRRWWVLLGTAYFVLSLWAEWRTYKRILALPVGDASAAPAPPSQAAGKSGTAGSPRGAASASSPRARSGAAATEGDAAAGKGNGSLSPNLVDYYMQKQQEMHKQRVQQGAQSVPTSVAGGLSPAGVPAAMSPGS